MTTWREWWRPDRDSVTDLPERAELVAILGDALVARAQDGVVAIAVVGLDRFSNVNAALGRAAGTEVLRIVARRLEDLGAAAARLGGDEFAVVAMGNDARAIGDRVAAVLDQPVEVDGRSVFLTASVGVALAPHDGDRADDLVQHADTAMQHAKERGGSAVLRYAGALRAEVEDRLRLASGLHLAIERNELVLHYQPIVRAGSRDVIGMEALVRWQHPTLGMIQPDRFIPIAEDTGLIVPIGEWVLDEACRQAVEWQRFASLRVAVNLSARQLDHQRMDDVIQRVLHRTGLDPHLLDVELTERAVLQDDESAAAMLQRLRTLGVSCAVDDFGTGYGGLSYLIRFPIGEIKIDRSFVQELDTSTSHAAIVASIVSLGRSLGLRVVAEGVETESQARHLESLGCDELQGFLMSRPVAAPEFERYVTGGSVSTHVVSGVKPRVVERPHADAPTSTGPAPVRPGPRRARRRAVPVIALTAAASALAMSGTASALPAFGAQTIAAVVRTVQDVVPGIAHDVPAAPVVVPASPIHRSTPTPVSPEATTHAPSHPSTSIDTGTVTAPVAPPASSAHHTGSSNAPESHDPPAASSQSEHVNASESHPAPRDDGEPTVTTTTTDLPAPSTTHPTQPSQDHTPPAQSSAHAVQPPADHTPPGQANKDDADKTPPGQAKSDDDKTPPGQARSNPSNV
ncbi:MAG: diguanylate cyclase [Actinomycetota bacterium]